MVFYLDLILLLNFVIDYLILLGTAEFLKLKIRRWRLGLGAAVGAAYTLVFFIPELTFSDLLFSKILLSIIIILISFGFVHLYQFIQTIATFYLISFILGGGVLAIQYLFNIEHEVINGIYVSKSSSPTMVVLTILLSIILIWFFSKRTYKTFWRKNNTSEQIVDVEIIIGEDVHRCKGLVDTGNRLYDPITRKPVMIIDASKILFIPQVIKKAYKNGQFQLEVFENISNEIDPSWLTRINLIPFRTVSKDMQFIIAIKPDKVVVTTKGNQPIESTKVLVGLDYEQLANDNLFQAIIHPELVTG